MSALNPKQVQNLLSGVKGRLVETSDRYQRQGGPSRVFVPDAKNLVEVVLIIANHRDDLERKLREHQSWSSLSEELLERPGEQR